MALREITVDWKYIKSYASRAALQKKLDDVRNHYPEHDDRYIVVQNPDGRWTAIVVLDKSTGGFIGRYDFLKV